MNLSRVQDLIKEIKAVKTTSNAIEVIRKFNNLLTEIGASIVISHTESHIIFNVLPITNKGLPDVLFSEKGTITCCLSLVHALLEYMLVQSQEICNEKDANKREESNTKENGKD